MMQILYLDDYINFYSEKLNDIKVIKPYKNTLLYGHIIDRNKFIKKMKLFLEEKKLNNNIFGETINVIINSSYNEEDKLLIKEVLEELNYKVINLINEINLIKIDKNTLFINYHYTYFYLYYLNEEGKIDIKMYENDYINKRLINNIIDIVNKKRLVINGKNINELINLINDKNYNFFYYEYPDNLYIKILKKNKSV